MLTSMSTPAMTQSLPFFAIDTNPSSVNATTGSKRHAGYGTGSDLAPGGAL